MFAALFFVSIGALMDITQMPLFIIPAIVLILASLGAKFFTVYLASKSQGHSTVTALRAGFGLSSGGELALVVAKGGADIGATSSIVLPMIGTMTIITTFITPYMIKMGWKLANRFSPSNTRGGLFSFRAKKNSK